jgi:hypothetical protein
VFARGDFSAIEVEVWHQQKNYLKMDKLHKIWINTDMICKKNHQETSRK